jgi:hypothetical protein
LKVFSDLVHEFLSGKILISGNIVGVVDANGQVLGHESILDGLDDGSLEGGCEGSKLGVVVKLCSLGETSGPGVDGGNGVG